MKTVKYSEYENDLMNFYMNHDDIKAETSSFENNRWHKNYASADGSVFFEVNEIVYEEATVEIHGLQFETTFKMFRTEYWSTENSASKYVYQKA